VLSEHQQLRGVAVAQVVRPNPGRLDLAVIRRKSHLTCVVRIGLPRSSVDTFLRLCHSRGGPAVGARAGQCKCDARRKPWHPADRWLAYNRDRVSLYFALQLSLMWRQPGQRMRSPADSIW